MQTLAPILNGGSHVLFEGQARLSFLEAAAAAAGIVDHRIILLDCDDATRTHRLSVARGQPDLANATMLNWARYLRGEAEYGGYEILNTAASPVESCVEQICRHF
jgi:hypothetical protein